VAIGRDVRPFSLLLEGFVKARIAASVVLAAAMMLGTTGCSFFATQATLKHYDPSDGVGATIGTVKVANALLLTKNGEEASLLVNLINTGEKAADVHIQYEGSDGKLTSTFRLAAGQVRTFGAADSPQLILQGINTEPGGLFPVWVQYGANTGKQLLVPVLDGSQKEYAGLLPTPTPTPTPSPTDIPTPSASPSK
jgi:hypothetical protein